MAIRLGDHLSSARHQQFVGREAERERFQAALAAAELPFHVLFVCGPGGVGKSSLLREFVYCCEQAGLPWISLDARNLDPSPESFQSALRSALGLAPEDTPLAAMAAKVDRGVLLIDTYELLAPLDSWLRDTFLPELPEHALVVIAGREPPSPAWRADAGWRSLLQVMPLRNLSPSESRAYLARRSVPLAQHDAILDFTHGHALALSLVADGFAQRPDDRFKPESAPDVVRALLQQFMQQVPGPAQRAALECCGLVRLTTEPLLADLLQMPDAHDLFEWLRGLSFIESGQQGIYPHDLAREALAADLRWRNPDWYAELHKRARSHYANRLQQVSPQEQQRVLIDYIFLHRDNPVVRPFFQLVHANPEGTDQHSAISMELARPADVPAVVDMVREHEGDEAAVLAKHWCEAQPEGVLVYRDAERNIVGLLLMVALDRASEAAVEADPATAKTAAYLAAHAPLRSGERATMFRFWMAHEGYQAVSATQSLIFVQMVRHYLTTPGLAFTFLPCSAPEFWAPVFAYADLARIEMADFAVGGRHYGVYGHDWRTTTPMQWLELMGEREMGRGTDAPASVSPPETVTVLSEAEFASAVQDALRHLYQPAALRLSPLLHSRFVLERAGANSGAPERMAALRAQLQDAIALLRESPRDSKLYRALHHTYVQPAVTQERAAEELDLPFSTFRRHLKAGVVQVAEELWRREINWLNR